MQPLQSLIQCGTRLWLDSIDPDLVRTWAGLGATGATSNPVIVSDLIATGRFDDSLMQLAEQGLDPETICWQLTDRLVASAEQVFRPIHQQTAGNDGYVSFELDPLIEDDASGTPLAARVERYVELGRKWSAGHPNRMIKVPATPAGLAALGPLVESGIPLNVTLIFSMRQYEAARDAIWNAASRAGLTDSFKSVYSIFVSRIDLYTEKHCPGLSAAAQGEVGIQNARQIWKANRSFWQSHPTRLDHPIVFASTGTKKPDDPPWKYVAALAGSDIQTNPPATNEAVANSNRTYSADIFLDPPESLLAGIREAVDAQQMEDVLMQEGLEKFCTPQKKLLELVARRAAGLAQPSGA